VNRSEIKRQVLDLAREGFLLPACPECGMFMDLETEALLGVCKSCGAEGLELELIPWVKKDFPKA
jgi:hypothetical protein